MRDERRQPQLGQRRRPRRCGDGHVRRVRWARGRTSYRGKRRRVSGFAGPTYFSEDREWTILNVKSGEHRLCRQQQPVGEFATLRLAQEAAEQATD
jgi:hypothetical protein